jgi:hypothetical protein
MIPCKSTCQNYTEGCHKTCARWKALMQQQQIKRQQQKAYLDYHHELCGTLIRQYRMMVSYRPIH